MAEIDVVPKHRSVSWVLWVILAIVVLFVLWWAFGHRATTATRLNKGQPAAALVMTVSDTSTLVRG